MKRNRTMHERAAHYTEALAGHAKPQRDLWRSDQLYIAVGMGSLTNESMPKDFAFTGTYMGMVLEIEASALKTNRLYRSWVTCHCGRRLPWAKMGQHHKACSGMELTLAMANVLAHVVRDPGVVSPDDVLPMTLRALQRRNLVRIVDGRLHKV